MRKKISLGTAVISLLLGCIATFQITYIVLHNKFEERYLGETLNAVHDVYYEGEGQQSSQNNSSVQQNGKLSPNTEFVNELASRIAEIDAYYRYYYIGELDDETLLNSAIAGYVAGTGDDYAAYYTAEAFDDFMSDLQAELVGIGVNVIYNTEYKLIEILSVVPDSPALEAGVEPGDLIYTIGSGDNIEYVADLGYYPTINKLRGEVGSIAEFSVLRGDNYSEVVQFSIARDKITEITVMSHVYALDGTVGVIKITGFDAGTPQQFADAVDELRGLGCTKLVIDLRYNPGGELSSIVTTLDYILPSGPIIRILDADGNEVDKYTSEATELDMPMAVIVNGSTASAAELFTSAVRDYEKATIVGTTTYGKGCMQTTVPLSFGGAVSVTYRLYSPPFGENYHEIGIIPDVEVELDPALEDKNIYKITDEEDNQLAAAVATFTD